MNQHPIYMTASSPRDDRHLDNLSSDTSGPTFQALGSFHPQTTTYYSPAPTTFHVTTPYGQDRKDYLSSIHGLTPVRLPDLSSSLSGNNSSEMMSTLGTLKEHPAAVQADQMNAYMEFFVDPEQSTSGQVHEDSIVIDDDLGHHHSQLLVTDKIMLDSLSDESILEGLGGSKRRVEMLKKRRQSDKERKELEDLLRESNDIDQDPDTIERVRTAQARARRAEAARSRYQRMSEAERKNFNQRRRLKALGIDPDSPKALQDPDVVKDSIRLANAKKAEAARLRYHRMSPEERREYNQRRTESFRRRRMEEEILLSTPAGRISAEALAKAQQIMIRNARKAEAARARYQRMTPEERKQYNIRRAQSKKARNRALSEARAAAVAAAAASNDCDLSASFLGIGSTLHSSLNTQFPSEPPANILEGLGPDPTPPASVPAQVASANSDPVSSPSSISTTVDIKPCLTPTTSTHPSPIPPKDTTSDDIFQQMERDVMKRTKQAHLTLAKQRYLTSSSGPAIPSTASSGNAMNNVSLSSTPLSGSSGMHDHNMSGDQHLLDDSQLQQFSHSQQIMIDEKLLRQILITGRDQNGQDVELRTMDGRIIREEGELNALGRGTPILIHPRQSTPISMSQSFSNHMGPSTSGQSNIYSHSTSSNQYRTSEGPSSTPNSLDKQALAKARRAERARIRYHSMLPEVRQEQNARRADLLRKSRQRDEQLVQLAETVDVNSLQPETRQAIVDAQTRRARRAEQARAKYHRMNSEERRQYNAMRDAQRRQRKRQQETRVREPNSSSSAVSGGGNDNQINNMGDASISNTSNASLSPHRQGHSDDGVVREQQIIYTTYDIYDDYKPLSSWDH
ncbi:unnamed protein product [Auanema sp. JU1783]|nr:unnamed protein product [Auanema sp. JU1783]